MEELMEKVENLKHVLDDSEEIQSFLCVQKKVMQDQKLLEQIRQYQEIQDFSLKQKIYKNPVFLDYKQKENDCHFFIMEINQRLKNIVGKGKHCQ